MSTTLYRKYRPQVWDEMTGQEVIVQTLRNEIATGRLAHAYLFSGPRGVGKTTVARILAKALNCERRIGGGLSSVRTEDSPQNIPCGSCTACTTIAEGRAIDVIEIDAASHTGVDMVREHIIENAQFLPTVFKTKVFIIDEVHMLTTPAFNALLKTLEEPPSQVYFILATTELHKVLETVISRCQRFDFKRIPADAIVQRLSQIAKKEKVKADASVLERIAVRAEGSLRDAESIFGQILALGEKEVTEATVDLVLPKSDYGHAMEFLEALLSSHLTPTLSSEEREQKKSPLPAACPPLLAARHCRRGEGKGEGGSFALNLLQILADEGADFEQFGKDCLTLSRALLLASVTGNVPAQIIDIPALRDRIAALAHSRGLSSGNPEDSPPYITFIDALRTRVAQIPSSPISSLPLELLAVEWNACHPERSPGVKVGAKPKDLPARPHRGDPSTEFTPIATSGTGMTSEKSIVALDDKKNNPPPIIDPQPTEHSSPSLTLDVIRAKWEVLIEAAREANHSFPFILKTAEPTAVDGGTLTVTVPYPFHRDQLAQPKIKAILAKVAETVFGAPLAWNPVLKDEPRATVSSPAVAELLEAFGGRVVE